MKRFSGEEHDRVLNQNGIPLIRGTALGALFESGYGNILRGVLLIAGAAVISGVLIFSDGNILAGGALIVLLAVVFMTFYRLDFGFYLFMGCVLVFDQFYIPEFEPLTYTISFFRNLKEIPYLPTHSAAVLNPPEVFILLMLFVWLILIGSRKDIRVNHVTVWGSALVFLFGLLGFLVYGMRTGGDFLVALWETRALFYLGMMYFFVPQIIQTKEQIRNLVWVFIAAISFKAFQGLYRFVGLGFNFQGIATLTNHEDPLFMLTLVMFLVGLIFFKSRDRQRGVLYALFPLLLIGFFVGQRRATYAAILPSLAVVISLFSLKQRMTFIKSMVPIVIVLVLYVAIFWESESRMASPVKLVKSGLSLDPEEAGDHYYSNLYREYEKINLAATVRTSPIYGIGFGNKYEMLVPLANINFPLRDYIPHNEILWLMVKTGMIGFFLFWFFLNSFAFQVGSISMKLQDPYLKAVCGLAASAIVGQIIVSYFDLQLTYYRNMIYLGVLMGVVSSIKALAERAHDPRLE